jgi:hypothetical protein
VCKLSQQKVQYKCSILLISQQFSQICDFWNNVSLRGVLSRFHHCGRMAMYINSQRIGVNPMINTTDNNWNQKDELRALASFIVRISIANRSKATVIAVQNRKELCIIVLKIPSDEVNGFQIISVISQLHSIIFIAV